MKKERTIWVYLTVLFVFFNVLTISCNKEEKIPVEVQLPTLTTSSVTNITSNSAKSGGNITSDGGAAINSRGVCWSTNQNPTITSDKTTDGTGTGSFVSTITGLNPGSTYYVRAYASNSSGIGYGSQAIIAITAILPTVSTSAISNVTSNTLSCGGDIISDGGASVTSRGVCWSTNQNPTLLDSKTDEGSGTGSFTSIITGLDANTIYHLRAYATNSSGTAYGTDRIITTIANKPVLTTLPLSAVTETTANCGGDITSDGGSVVISRGVCWSEYQNPTISNSKTIDGAGTGSFSSTITGLVSGSSYYVRAYATNSIGTGYGNQIILSTAFTISDIDGNVYKTVQVGNQFWMAENLKTTTTNDGYNIQNITSNSEWQNLGQGYCWYNNNITYKDTYGALYSFWLIKYSELCPTGWHIPTDSDWTTLTNSLGGVSVAGGKMKEIGTAHWTSPNTGATNVSGFTALPGGYRHDNGSFSQIGKNGYFWSSSQSLGFPDYTAWYRFLFYDYRDCSRDDGEQTLGMSIRCIKD